MIITEKEALSVVSLATMRSELRIPDDSADALLSGQIHDAANYVSQSTGLGLDDLAPLRAAIVAAVRSQYDGAAKLGPDAAHNSWMAPYRSYVAKD